MTKALLVLLFLLTPAVAHASDPFELPHPTTKEPGVWVPLWAQRLTLEMNTKLNTCTQERDGLNKLVLEKNAEVTASLAAVKTLSAALEADTKVIADLKQKLSVSKTVSERNYVWALIATGSALVTGTILVVVAVH